MILKTSAGVTVWDTDNIISVSAMIATAIALIPGGGGGAGQNIYIDPRDAIYAGGALTTNIAAANDAAFNAAFVAAATQHAYVILPPGTYAVNQVFIVNGARGFLGCGGTLLLANAANSGVILKGPFQGGAAPVNNLLIQGLRIDANNAAGPTVCIWADNAYDVRVLDNVIVNIAFGYGILFRNYTAAGALGGGNKIQRNKIFGTAQTFTAQWWGIYVDAQYVLGAATDEIDYWRRNFTDVPVTQPQSGYDIIDNRISGGYYGIGLGHVTDSVISGNNIQNNGRGISVQHSCLRNVITSNRVFECYSAGIHLTYGSSYNTVTANEVHTTIGVGEALVQAYIGCQYNLIESNILFSTEGTTGSQHGIYVAVNASYNTIANNAITGRFKFAGIGICSAWDADNTIAAFPYRYGAASDGSHTDWMANAATTGVVVKGNTIRRTVNTPGILLDQCTTHAGVTYTGPGGVQSVWNAAYTAAYQAALSDLSITGNEVIDTLGVNTLYMYETTAGKNSDHVMRGNRFAVPVGPHTQAVWVTYFVLVRNRAPFLQTENNINFDANVSSVQLVDNATPNVSVGRYFSCVNTVPTTITSFLGGIDGQELRLRLDNFCGITHTTGGAADTIRLAGQESIVAGGQNSDSWIELRRNGGVWFETSRSMVYLPGIPQNIQNIAYLTVMSDRGRHIFHNEATARIWTIDSNANVAYPIGTAITFVNAHGAGVITLKCSDTNYLGGVGTTADITIPDNCTATSLKLTATTWVTVGTGIS
jgi:parallel beta-helix repeat protein